MNSSSRTGQMINFFLFHIFTAITIIVLALFGNSVIDIRFTKTRCSVETVQSFTKAALIAMVTLEI